MNQKQFSKLVLAFLVLTTIGQVLGAFVDPESIGDLSQPAQVAALLGVLALLGSTFALFLVIGWQAIRTLCR